jgi:threonine dehydratase
MPRTAPLVKIRHTERTGATVILEGSTFDEAYERAQALAKQEGTRFVSAFDDHAIIAGQGTAGLEILEQCPDLDTIVVPVGGGGLASGIALAVKARRPEVMIIGVQSEWVLKSRAESKPPSETAIRPVTIADGIAVKRVGTLTGPIIGALLDSLISVNEGEIANGILRYLELERTMVEGAGAAALAAILAGKLPKGRRHTVVLACGGNIDMNVLSRLIERDMAQLGRLLKVVVSAPDRPGSLHRISGALSAQGANVLEVQHDRSFSKVPGNVDITFSMEVRDNAHKLRVLEQLRALGVEVRETTMLSTER